ncbi:MAG: hypothetical protein JW934_16490 [Anaerolineae bacterium]|nr:hypothetical protein [Anaerolineae bacterium]
MTTRPKAQSIMSGAQFVGIVVLTVILLLIVDYGRRASTGYYVAQAEEQLKAEIGIELTKNAQLKERLDYVQGEEYVEEWAREDGHMVRAGDRPLILVTVAAPFVLQSAPLPVQTNDATPQPTWYHWWYLFFDTPPGMFR